MGEGRHPPSTRVVFGNLEALQTHAIGTFVGI